MNKPKLVSFNLNKMTIDGVSVDKKTLQNMLLSKVAPKIKHFSYDNYTTMYRRINHNNDNVRKEVK